MKKTIFITLLITILIEVFIYNFDFFKTVFYKEKIYNKENIILNGITYKEEKERYLMTLKDGTLEIEVNEKLKNIYLDIQDIKHNTIEIFLDYTDDANNNYKKYNNKEYSRVIVNDIEKSKYIECNHLGNTHTIKIRVNNPTTDQFYINEISLNKPIPLEINFIRIFIIFSLIILFINFFIKSFVNIKKYENIFFWIIVITFSLLISFLYLNYSKINTLVQDYYSTNYKEALMKGQFHLDNANIQNLEVENIYDYTQRVGHYPWDVSYYNGNYYMYFSFLPALILGICDLSVSNLCIIISVISIIFLSLLTKKIIEKFFPNTSSGLKLLMILFVLFNSRLLLILSRVRFYELIVLSAFCFSVIGLYFYLLYHENLKKRYLFLGSIFLGLSITCRPSMLFIALLGFIFLYKKINKNNFIPYFIPYVFFGLILMYINYIRFENPFEFGIKYQLTVVDMHYLKFNFNTILNGIYTYLFKMPNIIPNFPYIINNVSMMDYNGFYFNTANGNGILSMSILALVLPFVYKKIDKKILKFISVSMFIGIIILIIDNAFGGSLKRYSLEFAWLFIIPIVLLTIHFLHKKKKTVLILVLISCFLNFFIIFDNKSDDLGNLRENDLYYDMKYLIEP